MPTLDQKLRAGRAQEATAATICATTGDQVTGAARAGTQRQADLARNVTAMAESLQDRPAALAELDRLRTDQQRQIDTVRDTAVSALETLRKAADELDRRQQREVAECPDRPQDRQQLAERHRREAGDLAVVRDDTSRDLRSIGDQQEGLLANQRRAFRDAAQDGTLTRRADELADTRAADERLIKQRATELVDRTRRQLADATAVSGSTAPAGPTRERGQRVSVDRAWPATFPDRLGPLSEAEQADIRRNTVGADPRLDPLRRFIDRIGERAAEILTGEETPYPALKERFTAACQRARDAERGRPRDNSDLLAGSTFHLAAEAAAKEMKDQVPDGWNMEVERRLADREGTVDSRLDLLFHRPGEAFNVDWKTTGRSALASVSEMERHEERARDHLAQTYDTAPEAIGFQQESRSWTEYLTRGQNPRPTRPSGPAEGAVGDQMARERAAREQAAREQAAREQAGRERTTRETIERSRHDAGSDRP